MSEPPPPTTSTTPSPQPPYPTTYKHHLIHTATAIRDYRKGNWTPEETLILITAKKLDDERRVTNATTTSATRPGGELRWKWVENYCWSKGCYRSQNQCNDKWDNLLRDYKKVRDYELVQTQNRPSYWGMDKIQRKQRNLPSNMLPNIFEALNDVVNKKHFAQKPLFQHQHQQQPALAVLPPPPPPAAAPEAAQPPPPTPPASAESLESQGEGEGEGEDQAEKVESETKRRRAIRDDIGSSIIQSTQLLSQTLKHYDDNKEKRHKRLMELEQQRLQLEEARNEVNSQGMAALITSINKLSDAIHALISEKRT